MELVLPKMAIQATNNALARALAESLLVTVIEQDDGLKVCGLASQVERAAFFADGFRAAMEYVARG